MTRRRLESWELSDNLRAEANELRRKPCGKCSASDWSNEIEDFKEDIVLASGVKVTATSWGIYCLRCEAFLPLLVPIKESSLIAMKALEAQMRPSRLLRALGRLLQVLGVGLVIAGVIASDGRMPMGSMIAGSCLFLFGAYLGKNGSVSAASKLP